jgi:Glucodextranase, domain B
MSARACWTLIAALAVPVGMTACGSSDESAATAPPKANTPVSVEISAPADGSSSRADRVTVRGTVTPPDATVQVIGRSAQVGNGVFIASVALRRGSNTIDVVASAVGSAPASTAVTVTRTPAKLRTSNPIRPDRAPLLSAATNCGGGLTAGARTSCAFAENVRATYAQSGSGVLDVYSPTTGRTYRMYCTSSSPHVCTGGNGASVYFADSDAVRAYDTSGCGNGLVVGPNTSCGFAANVRAEYYRSGASSIVVHSPATGRSYNMFCTSTSPRVCTGGNNAAVYFP